MRYYEYRRIVSFEEINLVGNVYYTNHLSWQRRCRELFLRDHAPDVIDELSRGLSLAAVRCSCEYLAELTAFDEVIVRMGVAELLQNRLTLAFE
jgi:enediyne biosynthesis thioesterase